MISVNYIFEGACSDGYATPFQDLYVIALPPRRTLSSSLLSRSLTPSFFSRSLCCNSDIIAPPSRLRLYISNEVAPLQISNAIAPLLSLLSRSLTLSFLFKSSTSQLQCNGL
ncbi:hypothetical protein GmHk_20G058727 [Glycine max]|nr:hypothetical protein GmHk_20G058727 [Glycine max]